MLLPNAYVAEYSMQEGYHIETLKEAITNNLSTIFRNIPKDYLIIGVFPDYDGASDFIKEHRIAMEQHKEIEV